MKGIYQDIVNEIQSLITSGEDPRLEVSTIFLSKLKKHNLQISACLSHFFYIEFPFNSFVFML